MANKARLTLKEAEEALSELRSDSLPLYRVYPDPDIGSTLVVGPESFSWFSESRGVGKTRHATKLTGKSTFQNMAVSSIRMAHDRVRRAVSTEDLIHVLDDLSVIRSAAERQLSRYEEAVGFRERRGERFWSSNLAEAKIESWALGIDHEAQIEAWGLGITHEFVKGWVQTLALVAACDFVEAWYLETGDLPNETDLTGPDPELVSEAMTEARRKHCYKILGAFKDSTGGFDKMGDLSAEVGETPVKKAQEVLRKAQVPYEHGNPDSFEKALRSVMNVDSGQTGDTF